MKMLIINRIHALLIFSLVYFQSGFSQQTAKFIADGSSIQIKGTSNLHDWEEKVQKFNVELVYHLSNNEISGIDKVAFSCKSASVTSDNSIMTSKTNDALKVEKYPDIKFTLSNVDFFQNNNGEINGSITGDLFLAGVTNKIKLLFKGNTTSGKLILKGSIQIKMSDFKINPPTAMFGALKTGDSVELFYSIQFEIG